MFNNPFDSFHNTVAEAKEERERLDRLLTISTPRERSLLAVIALLLVVLAAWLFLGSVSRSVAVSGVLVEPGATADAGNRSAHAILWVGNDLAPPIEPGMPATIELGTAENGADALEGVVAAISAVPLSERLGTLHSAAPVSVHRVDISLAESLDYDSLVGRKCRIVIQIGRQPPIALLLTRRS